MLALCVIVLFWIIPSLMTGNSFEKSMKDLIYSIGFLVAVAFIGYIFYKTVLEEDDK